jgi:parallel beta-helix repeat protein
VVHFARAVTIMKNALSHGAAGILVSDVSDCVISLNSVAFNGAGIHLERISGCLVTRNNVSRSLDPFRLDCSWDGLGSSTFVRNSCRTEEPPGAWD